jgi:uncharacterized protein
MKNHFPDHTETFFIDGPAGKLEVLTVKPLNFSSKKVAIICHPNPEQSGTMQNKVVTTLAKVFERLEIPSVRFNFRGVGQSEGQHGKTIGEADDLRAVVAWVKQVLPDCEIILAGFSFGSYIAAIVANEINPAYLISIPPPADRYDFNQFNHIHCPWWVVMGEADEVVAPADVIAWAQNSSIPLHFILLPGIGHFFHGHLVELRELLFEKLSSTENKNG